MPYLARTYSVQYAQISGVSKSDISILECLLVRDEYCILSSGWALFVNTGFEPTDIDPFCHGLSQELHDILVDLYDNGRTNIDILEFYGEE